MSFFLLISRGIDRLNQSVGLFTTWLILATTLISAGNAIVLVLVMIGGGTIPLAFMPPFLRAASQASPFSWAILAIEGAVWRGFAFTEMLAPLGILLFIGALGLVLGKTFIQKRARV